MRGTGLLASDAFEISTEAIAVRERFDFYCESARANYLGFDMSAKGEGEFHGRMQGITAGEAVINRTNLSPTSFTRTRRSMLDHDESVVVMHTRSGRGRVSQAGKDLPLSPGGFALYVSTIPSVIELLEPTTRVSVKLPRAMIETLLGPRNVIGPTQFSAGDPLMKLLFGYAGACTRHLAAPAAAGQAAARHMADLLALALGTHRDSEAEIAERGLKAARTDAVLRTIASSFASPFVSPATVGSSLGISERHVHRLLEETNRTFYEHLLEARLAHSYCQLTDPILGPTRSIAAVAAESGFTNISYFNRVFRQRFGDTPSSVRIGARFA